MIQEIQIFLGRASRKPKLVCIIGPTASGKTGVAVEIAKKFDGEIINADSKQMYRHLQIGTAKPTPEEMQGVAHHLFDFLNPDEECNVAEWRELAEQKIEEITGRKKLPILCGGTGLFVNALTQNFTIPRIEPQTEFRKKMETLSSEEVWERLNAIDPDEAQKIPVQNKRFLIRALEIYEFSGKKKSEIMGTAEENYDTFFVGLTMEREKLYQKIENRIDQMKKEGFLEEVKFLLEKGYTSETPATKSIGYPEAITFLNGNISETALWETMKQNSRRYAKRQLTWWRRDARVHWFDSVSRNPLDMKNPIY